MNTTVLQSEKKSLLKEAFIAWLIVILGSRLFFTLQSISLVKENLSLFTAALLLYVPIIIFFKKRKRMEYWDSSIKKFALSLRLAILVSLVIFPIALVVNHTYQNIFFGNTYHSHSFSKLGEYFLFEILVVALPEEFFFRGYLQGRLNQIFGKPWKLLSASVGPGLLFTSLIFAISHSLIQVQWWHLLIFFPSLVFGWLKEKQGTLTAPILFHTLCNLFSHWVLLHYQ